MSGKKSVGFLPLLATASTATEDYGSTESSTTNLSGDSVQDSNDGEDNNNNSPRLLSSQRSSSFSGLRYSLLRDNMWTSHEDTAENYNFDLVPTQLTNNVKFVTDPNLEEKEKGSVWYAEASFYNHNVEPEYALTVNSDIYRRIWCEVNDAKEIPCGLYFCCHGGDGAHTGVSHDDHVDIRLAWVLLACIFVAMMFLEVVLPYSDDDY